LYNARRVYIYWIIISKKSYKNSKSILIISDPFTKRQIIRKNYDRILQKKPEYYLL